MPKMKTKSSAKKRFKLTGSGKIKRKHAFKNHILTKKSKKRKLKLTHSGLVDDSDKKSIKEQLESIDIINIDILPLLNRMIDSLRKFVELDLPFLFNERIKKISLQ